ncbi:MAG TPA: EAL domain-containing protein, partial [Polyangiaceae bacterium]|nr:EAL domain-containing protein [Polyangiaceae bacterium]
LAGDVAAAREAIRHQAFDVVLSDIQMPGPSGVDLLRSVRAHDLDVPVMLMTGNPTIETAMEAVQLGALQYLQKPTPNDVLLAAVERACRLHALARMKRDALQLLGEDPAQAGDRAGLQASFERALESMWIAFQPIVDEGKRQVFGFEALMRSHERSLPHPGAILNAGERLGRLPEIGRRVRKLSAEAFGRAPEGATLFVNLHTRDLLDDALYEPKAALASMAQRVVFEITERSAIDDVKDVHARIAELRRLGFRIAIDDLGAGYAGLSSFAVLEPEVVKLDMSLIRNLHQSSVRRKLVRSMTALCKEMRIQVVAEGVETIEERDAVRGLGCDLSQGYLFARPGPPFPSASMPG